MLTVLVCGGRDYADKAAVRRALERLPAGTTVFHGAARGADSLAGEVARDLGLEVRAFPADWKHYGRSAGPIRNAAMLKELLLREGERRVLAFPGGRGTAHMVTIAEKAGVQVVRGGGGDESEKSGGL